MFSKIIVALATGCGIGRLPKAQGTAASLAALPLIWLIAHAYSPDFEVYLAVVVFLFSFSIPICGHAAREMNDPDPSAIVLDEIVGMFVSAIPYAMFVSFFHTYFDFTKIHSIILSAILILFRIFDIFKPWPIFLAEKLPGGWGIVMDDFVAAIFSASIITAALLYYISQSMQSLVCN